MKHMNIICTLFGHRLRYNFRWLPNKCICKRCYMKWAATHTTPCEWIEVTAFEGEMCTDKELSKKWVK